LTYLLAATFEQGVLNVLDKTLVCCDLCSIY